MRWIVTDDIYVETWRRLLEFSNFELAFDEIVRRHGTPMTKPDRENKSKQAKQARVCVLQAKEYFDAARSSSLFTSPNHAYYGSVALASLMMLILGDGTRSLDYLRLDNKNNHHGLNLTTGCSANMATKGLALLERTQVEILKFGHFANWYQSLPGRGSIHAIWHQYRGSTSSANYLPAGGFNVPDFATLQGKKKSIIDILQFLPDLDGDLHRFGVSSPRSRTSYKIEETNDGTRIHTWTVHGCRTPQERDALLEEFAVTPRFAESLSAIGTENTSSAIVSLQFKMPDVISFKWPTSRETLNHDTISYAKDPETHEIVDLYLVAYQLSMLSRYHPDIWVSCIESQCRGAKLIERAVEIISKKLPILALSMLGSEEVVISTHREPWKTQ
jgi:YaaC-like Protein